MNGHNRCDKCDALIPPDAGALCDRCADTEWDRHYDRHDDGDSE